MSKTILRTRRIQAYWTAQQLKMQELEANPFDDRTLEEKAKEVGISERLVYFWRARPGWRDAVYDMAKKWIGDRAPDVLRSLVHQAKKGDVQAIRLYLEVIGKYTPKAEMDIRAGRLEELSDDELKNIIENGPPLEGGGGEGVGEAAEGGQDNLLPSPQAAGEVSPEPSGN